VSNRGRVTGDPDADGRGLPGPAAEVHALLASGSDLAVLDALGCVLRWSTDVLQADALRGPAAAFRAVAAADRALAEAPALFAALAPLVDRGEPGRQVSVDLARHEARLAELAQRTAPLRDRLVTLMRVEERLGNETREHDEIVARIAELERLERLAAAVADLRTQRDNLETRAREISVIAADAEAGVTMAGQRLITLTAELLESLADGTRDVLCRARDQDQLLQTSLAERRAAMAQAEAGMAQLHAELAEAEAMAAEAQARFERAQAEAAGRLAALRRYATADRRVCDGLARPEGITGKEEAHPGIADAAAALDDVEVQLAKVDEILANAHAEQEQARHRLRAPLHLGGAAPAEPSPKED